MKEATIPPPGQTGIQVAATNTATTATTATTASSTIIGAQSTASDAKVLSGAGSDTSTPSLAEKTLPVTGAWLEGDPLGQRKFAEIGPLPLENGQFLPTARLSYETWGTLNSDRSNAILILHALTGDSHVYGDAAPGHPSPGWWSDIVKPGGAIDIDKYFVVAPNVLGGCQGSTGPSSIAPDGKPWGSRFPLISTRDMVQAESRLTDYLGITSWAAVIGASAGGHRALEWAVGESERVEKSILVATGSYTTADQMAWCHAQLAAIELDPGFKDGDYYDSAPGEGPTSGLGIARRIAHTTYRSADELNTRFGRLPQKDEAPLVGGRYAVQSYLDHHATKLAHRFDAGSYHRITQAAITFDIGRDRGGVSSALKKVQAKVLAIGIDTDRLFHPAAVRELAEQVPDGIYREVQTPHGHDGFLVESDQIDSILREFLD